MPDGRHIFFGRCEGSGRNFDARRVPEYGDTPSRRLADRFRRVFFRKIQSAAGGSAPDRSSRLWGNRRGRTYTPQEIHLRAARRYLRWSDIAHKRVRGFCYIYESIADILDPVRTVCRKARYVLVYRPRGLSPTSIQHAPFRSESGGLMTYTVSYRFEYIYPL